MRKNSFIQQITLALLIFTAFLIFILTFIWINTISVLEQNGENSLSNAVRAGLFRLDQIFSANENILATLFEQEEYINSLSNKNSLKRLLSIHKLLMVMDDLTVGTNDAQMLMVYDWAFDMYGAKRGNTLSFTDEQNIRDLLISRIPDSQKTHIARWQFFKIGEKAFFIRSYYKNTYLIAAVVPVDFWAKSLFQADNEMIFVLSERNGNQLLTFTKPDRTEDQSKNALFSSNLNADQQNETVLTYDSPVDRTELTFSASLPRRDVLGNLHFIQILIPTMVAIAIVSMMVFIFYANKNISLPIKKLVSGMKKFETGDDKVRLPESAKNNEFIQINRGFNQMVDAIVNLRIKTYEDKISYDEATLQHIQARIRPHFVLNALTTIHGMTYQGRVNDIREYIERLSKYVRYLFKADLCTVPLIDEIVHVRNYIGMQEFLYPDCVFDSFEIDDTVKSFPIQQLLIHTLIENTYKHAVSTDRLTCVLISAKPETRDSIEICHVTVEDDGPGFPAETLVELETGKTGTKKDGHGIGLMTMKKALELAYGSNDLIFFSNKHPHGTRIDLFIPRTRKQELIPKDRTENQND